MNHQRNSSKRIKYKSPSSLFLLVFYIFTISTTYFAWYSDPIYHPSKLPCSQIIYLDFFSWFWIFFPTLLHSFSSFYFKQCNFTFFHFVLTRSHYTLLCKSVIRFSLTYFVLPIQHLILCSFFHSHFFFFFWLLAIPTAYPSICLLTHLLNIWMSPWVRLFNFLELPLNHLCFNELSKKWIQRRLVF